MFGCGFAAADSRTDCRAHLTRLQRRSWLTSVLFLADDPRSKILGLLMLVSRCCISILAGAVDSGARCRKGRGSDGLEQMQVWHSSSISDAPPTTNPPCKGLTSFYATSLRRLRLRAADFSTRLVERAHVTLILIPDGAMIYRFR